MKRPILLPFIFIFAFCLGAFAQNLSVRDIMAEPSIAGMRVESQRLSPDGKYAVFMWNAEGKEPKNLYLASTGGGDARILVRPQDLLSPVTPPAENKLNYGVIVNDEFVKARQNQIGILDWSPDSKQVLFGQNGDLYILDIKEANAKPRRLTRTQSAEFAARFL